MQHLICLVPYHKPLVFRTLHNMASLYHRHKTLPMTLWYLYNTAKAMSRWQYIDHCKTSYRIIPSVQCLLGMTTLLCNTAMPTHKVCRMRLQQPPTPNASRHIYTTTTHLDHHMLSQLPRPAATSKYNGSMTTDKGGRMLKQPPMLAVVLQYTNVMIPGSDQHNLLQHHCDHQPLQLQPHHDTVQTITTYPWNRP